jgi:hypothetical protein
MEGEYGSLPVSAKVIFSEDFQRLNVGKPAKLPNCGKTVTRDRNALMIT